MDTCNGLEKASTKRGLLFTDVSVNRRTTPPPPGFTYILEKVVFFFGGGDEMEGGASGKGGSAKNNFYFYFTVQSILHPSNNYSGLGLTPSSPFTDMSAKSRCFYFKAFPWNTGKLRKLLYVLKANKESKVLAQKSYQSADDINATQMHRAGCSKNLIIPSGRSITLGGRQNTEQ